MTAGIDLAAEPVGMVQREVIAQLMGQPQAVAALRASAAEKHQGLGLQSATFTGNSGSRRLGVPTRPSSTSTSLAMIDEMRARRWLRLASTSSIHPFHSTPFTSSRSSPDSSCRLSRVPAYSSSNSSRAAELRLASFSRMCPRATTTRVKFRELGRR